MSHSPLLNLPGPPRSLLDEVEAEIARARAFVADYDPELVVIFSPDHYNGFFYKVMPPFCIGMRASGVGDYGTHAGPLEVAEDLALDCATAVLDAGVDVAVSAGMDVDHGTVQPLEKLCGSATAVPVIPIFVNAIAVPLGPLHRCRALGTAVGNFVGKLDKKGAAGRLRRPVAQPPGAHPGHGRAGGAGTHRAGPADDRRAAPSPADAGDRGGPQFRPGATATCNR
ncbi:hypothetical protein IWGMT90018_54940 [Mycobacterium kiyosense]|nr:hypothetical protein IWGMT90018_54940 [Mycobacterium kiyosense]